jgi:hypothetical protein
MALIECLECGKEISDEAEFCPNCSYPYPTPKIINNIQVLLRVLGTILTEFQYMEELLKMYLSDCYILIKSEVSEIIPFKYSRTDVETNSLRRLIDKFEKVNNNTGLLALLRQLTKVRNDVAHRGIMFKLHKTGDSEYLNSELESYNEHRREVERCSELLLDELAQMEKRRDEKTLTIPDK